VGNRRIGDVKKCSCSKFVCDSEGLRMNKRLSFMGAMLIVALMLFGCGSSSAPDINLIVSELEKELAGSIEFGEIRRESNALSTSVLSNATVDNVSFKILNEEGKSGLMYVCDKESACLLKKETEMPGWGRRYLSKSGLVLVLFDNALKLETNQKIMTVIDKH